MEGPRGRTRRTALNRINRPKRDQERDREQKRKVSNRAADLTRFRDESSDLQGRIERFKAVAREAAAKAQMINSGTLTLRHTASDTAIAGSLPARQQAWPSSVSYRCTTQHSRHQRATAPQEGMRAGARHASTTAAASHMKKTQDGKTLSMGDFLATVSSEHLANTLKRRRDAPPTSPSGHEEGESAGRGEDAEAVLRSPALKRKLQQALAAQREATQPSETIRTIAPLVASSRSSSEAEMELNCLSDEHKTVIDAMREGSRVETKTAKDSKAHKEKLKRKDMVVRKKGVADEHDQQTQRVSAQQEADEEERKAKAGSGGGGKKRKATAFLSSMLNKSKRVKKDKADQQQKREDDAKAKEAIEQEKHNQRVAYIKRRIEERYGVGARRDSSMRSSGKRVRILEPTGAADGEATVTPETQDKDEAAGRRRRAMTMEEVMTGSSETAAAASIALAKKNSRDAGGGDGKENAERPRTRSSASSPFKTMTTSTTATGVSESGEATSKRTTSDPPVFSPSLAGGRAIYVPRRPLQARNV